jgi:excisionase family DNA binding protein
MGTDGVKTKEHLRKDAGAMTHGSARVHSLASHPEPYVTTGDLAQYWGVSRKQIHKQIEEGNLPAIRLGPRSLRIPTQGAADFECRSVFHPRGAATECDRRVGDDEAAALEARGRRSRRD